MRIVIAPDSFKESLSALEVARHIETGFRAVFPDFEYVKVPVADGGEGTVDALVAATGGHIVTCVVEGPLGEPVEAAYGLTSDGKTAIIEMACASGLMLVPFDQRDPLSASTYGVGQLISAALDAGARHFIVGIGGSATNDGGAGMAQALGVRLLTRDGDDVPKGGGALHHLAHIDVAGLDPRLAASTIEVACDIDNPLVGPQGASAVFGPQKGATPETVDLLERNLRNLAERIEEDLQRSVADLPGGGAAGGLGAGLAAFLGAELSPGFEIVARAIGLDEIIAGADLVLTGEGRIDSQSVRGKTPVGVARLAARHEKPVIAIAGILGSGADLVRAHGIGAMFSVLQRSCTVEEALSAAPENVRAAARNVAAALKIGGELFCAAPLSETGSERDMS